MLPITIPRQEWWDESTERFVTFPEHKLQLEHSLVSVRKWESKWCKPFLSKEKKTGEETLDYIKCMTLTQNVSPDVYLRLTDDNIREIDEYIAAPMTATTFSEDKGRKGKQEIITAEIIYWWMIALTIPPQYEKWHLNSLLALIKVCSIKNSPPKKMSRTEIARQNAALNKARRKQLNTKG